MKNGNHTKNTKLKKNQLSRKRTRTKKEEVEAEDNLINEIRNIKFSFDAPKMDKFESQYQNSSYNDVAYPVKSLFHFVQIYKNINNKLNQSSNYNMMTHMTDNFSDFESYMNEYKEDPEYISLKEIYEKYQKDKKELKMIINPTNLKVNIIDGIDTVEHLDTLIDYYSKKKENAEFKQIERNERKEELSNIMSELNIAYHRTRDEPIDDRDDSIDKIRRKYLKFISGDNKVSTVYKDVYDDIDIKNETIKSFKNKKVYMEYSSNNIDNKLLESDIFMPTTTTTTTTLKN